MSWWGATRRRSGRRLGYLEDTAVMVRRGHAGEHVQRGGGFDRGGLPAPDEPGA